MAEVTCYAFYGSLRRGMFNFEHYKNHMQFVSLTTLPGFKLFALPEYPIAIKTNSIKDSIVAEIFKITSSSVESEIHKMEIEAGYYFDILELNEQKTGIYLFKSSQNYRPVPGGDWVKYFEKNLNAE